MENSAGKYEKTLTRGRILWKSMRLFLQIKGPLSLAAGVIGLPMAVLPLLLSRQLQRLTDALFMLMPGQGGEMRTVMTALLFLGAVFLLQLFWQLLEGYVRIQDMYRTQEAIKETVLGHVCTVHYSYLENRDDFHSKIAFADAFACQEVAMSIGGMFDVWYQLITFATVGFALWAIHPAFVLILVITGVPAAVLSFLQADETFRHRTKWSEEGHMAIHLYHLCTSTDHGIQELRHYELYDYLKAKWRAVADSYLYKKNKLAAKHVKANMAADFLRSAVYLILLLMTARMIYRNPALGLGIFTLVYTLSDRLQRTIGNILTEIMQFSTCLSYMKEFFSLEKLERDEADGGEELLRGSEGSGMTKLPGAGMESEKAAADGDGAAGLPAENVCSAERCEVSAGDIKFDHVSFAYPGTEREALSDIHLTIRAGEKIAIVGDNGSGKSTFISLLTGIFSPDSGGVSIGGLSMETHKHMLRERISVIFQDFAHYEASIRENITVSDPGRVLSDEEILALARRIQVEDVIAEQPEGLDGMLGHMSEKGNTLSGGQWQKIALLRAVYRSRADIMILDEPTAALDPIAEAQLYRNFSQLTGNRTALLISHRLGITGLVDRILVFREGRIVEDGSHKELMARQGHYYAMYQAQAKWYQ